MVNFIIINCDTYMKKKNIFKLLYLAMIAISINLWGAQTPFRVVAHQTATIDAATLRS